jgi:hypothetical protein
MVMTTTMSGVLGYFFIEYAFDIILILGITFIVALALSGILAAWAGAKGAGGV